MHVEAGRSYFLGVALPGDGFEVISQDPFIAKPQLTITLHDCEAFDFHDSEDANYDRVVEPVLGRKNHFGIDPGDFGPIVPRDYPVAWSNRENDVEVTLTPDSFRPNVAWRTDQDDYVVVCRDPEATSVRLTWVLTEDGNDATTRGELEVAPGSVIDAGELFKSSFLDGAD